MQIEQVIGRVDGNTNVQAIQLRMRAATETQVQAARLIVRDASEANPILLVDFTTPVIAGAVGARILAATRTSRPSRPHRWRQTSYSLI